MHLDDMQDSVDEWMRNHGEDCDKFQLLARLSEELGQVATALQRQEGLRPAREEVTLNGEVGDLLFMLAAFASANGIRLSQSIAGAMEKLRTRDSDAW
jgi:NTP pyrophosphatase (non-canonical NTP hydrolase)